MPLIEDRPILISILESVTLILMMIEGRSMDTLTPPVISPPIVVSLIRTTPIIAMIVVVMIVSITTLVRTRWILSSSSHAVPFRTYCLFLTRMGTSSLACLLVWVNASRLGLLRCRLVLRKIVDFSHAYLDRVLGFIQELSQDFSGCLRALLMASSSAKLTARVFTKGEL